MGVLSDTAPVFPDMYISKTKKMCYKKKRWVVRRESKGIYLATSSEQANKKYPTPFSPLDKLLKTKD